MPKQSAGLLIYRRYNGQLEVFLVHPGGPFWQHKDQAAWSIPKGEFTKEEDPLDAAKREFHEETGFDATGPFLPLGPLKQPSGKVVYAWIAEGDFDPSLLRSNTFKLEWPRNSGKFIDVPEADRAEWFSVAAAREKILPGQLPFLDHTENLLSADPGTRN
jgi:predicted NUDIX family NTP pyrophosphohydrolase